MGDKFIQPKNKYNVMIIVGEDGSWKLAKPEGMMICGINKVVGGIGEAVELA